LSMSSDFLLSHVAPRPVIFPTFNLSLLLPTSSFPVPPRGRLPSACGLSAPLPSLLSCVRHNAHCYVIALPQANLAPSSVVSSVCFPSLTSLPGLVRVSGPIQVWFCSFPFQISPLVSPPLPGRSFPPLFPLISVLFYFFPNPKFFLLFSRIVPIRLRLEGPSNPKEVLTRFFPPCPLLFCDRLLSPPPTKPPLAGALHRTHLLPIRMLRFRLFMRAPPLTP